MPQFLFHVPLPVAGCLIIGSLCAYSLIGLMLVVRLPNALWFVITFGACISLGSTFLFKVNDVRLDATQVPLLSVFVGLVVMLILAFDRPFLGDLGIDPSPYQLVREQLMNP